MAADPFLEFLRLIAKLYRGPSDAPAAASTDTDTGSTELYSLSPAPAPDDSLTADSAARGVGDSGLLSLANTDVGNFNLELDISLSDSEDSDNDTRAGIRWAKLDSNIRPRKYSNIRIIFECLVSPYTRCFIKHPPVFTVTAFFPSAKNETTVLGNG